MSLSLGARTGNLADVRSVAYQRYIVFLLAAVNISSYTDRNVLAALAPAIKADLSLTDTQWGFVSGLAFAAPYALLSIPLAVLADRWSRRGVITLALVCWSGMTTLCGFVRSMPQLIVARIGVGAGESGCLPAGHAIIASQVPPEKRAGALALHSLGIPIGSACGFMLGGLIAQAYGWRDAFLWLGAPGVLLAIVCRVTLPRTPKAPQAIGVTGAIEGPQTLFQLIKQRPAFFHLAMTFGATALFASAKNQWLPSFYVRSYHYSIAQSGVSFGLANGAASIIGVLLGGALSDRLHRVGVHRVVQFVLIADVMTWIFNIVTLASPSSQISLAFNFFSGLTAFLGHGALFSLVQGTAPENLRSRAASLMTMLSALIGMSIGPLVVGVLSDRLALFGPESLRWALLLSSSLSLWPIIHLFLAVKTINADTVKT